MRGSVILEASMNFVWMIGCLIFVVYMGMYLHDKTILESAAAEAAQAGRLYIVENQMIGEGAIDWDRFEEKGLLWRLLGEKNFEWIADYAQKLTEGRLVSCEKPDFYSEIGWESVKVNYCAKTRLAGMFLSGIGINISQISGSVTESGMESEEFLRLVKVIVEER